MVIYQSLGVGKQILTQRSFFLKQKAILHKAFERANNERVNSLLFFRCCLCRHILQNPRKKATHFKKCQTTNSSINLTPLLQTILNCSVFVLVIIFFLFRTGPKIYFQIFQERRSVQSSNTSVYCYPLKYSISLLFVNALISYED